MHEPISTTHYLGQSRHNEIERKYSQFPSGDFAALDEPKASRIRKLTAVLISAIIVIWFVAQITAF